MIKINHGSLIRIILLLFLISLLFSNLSFAYKISSTSNNEVHQYITKESGKVWEDIPNEMEAHLQNPYDANIFTPSNLAPDYQVGDDIITGAGEDVFVIVQHAYTSAGTYNVNATGQSGSKRDSKNLTIEVS